MDFVLRVEVLISEEIRTERCVQITDGHDRACVCVCVCVCVVERCMT